MNMAGKKPNTGTPKDKRLVGRGMKPGPKPATPKKGK
jgi:hypothetical protein